MHKRMCEYLAKYKLRPLVASKVEEFVFGNCNTELSDKNFLHPVFFNGTCCTAVDISRIKPECPPLLSKGRLRAWDASMDFGKEQTYLKEYNHVSFCESLALSGHL